MRNRSRWFTILRSITYGQLLRVYFSVAHDPDGAQSPGPRRGNIVPLGDLLHQRRAEAHGQAYIAQLDAAKVFPQRIVTEVTPLKGFYRAEDYHQDLRDDYNPDNSLHSEFATCPRSRR